MGRLNTVFNVYCDESCHLEHDHQSVMVLGAIWCPLERTRDIAEKLRALKEKHGLSPTFELKWTKVSPGQLAFYLELVDFFFDEPDLHFRALIVPDKSQLDHAAFDQTHDDWYFKMYFDMLKVIFDPSERYRIYLDVKDTRSAPKVAKLHEVLRNSLYDFSREIIQHIQTIRSHESEHLQLADLLIGAISYVNREAMGSAAKLAIVQRIQQRSGYSLRHTTLLREDKINLLRWKARETAG